jgi:hypothetical protein
MRCHSTLVMIVMTAGQVLGQPSEPRRYLFPRSSGHGPFVGMTVSPPGYFGPGSLFYAGGAATGWARPTAYPTLGTPALGYPGLGYPGYTPGAAAGRFGK